MPVEARLKTRLSASSTERFRPSALEISGAGAPGLTVTPSPTRPTLTRSAATLPSFAKPSIAAGGAITTSNVSPADTRFTICGVVLNVILTWWPVSFWNAATALWSPGSIAPPLRTVISPAIAAPQPRIQLASTANSVFIPSLHVVHRLDSADAREL